MRSFEHQQFMHARGFLCLSVVYSIASSSSSFRIGCKADGGPKLFTIHQLKRGPFLPYITCMGRWWPDVAFWHGKLFSAKQLYMISWKITKLLSKVEPSLVRQWNAIEMAFRCRDDDGPHRPDFSDILSPYQLDKIFDPLINYVQKKNWTPSEKKLSWSVHGIYNLQAQTRRHRP